MEEAKERLRAHGLGICAISYDSHEVLQHFANRKKITVPLLSDPGSKTIRAFGILNTNIAPEEFGFGIPFPGTYLVNEKGIVISKFFEEDYRQRYSVGTVLTELYESPLGTRETVIENEHLTMKYYASATFAAAGNRVTLITDVVLKDKMHLYAPGAKGYLPVDWELEPSAAFSAHAVDYPHSRSLYLPAIEEEVPVYQNTVRITQDITINPNRRELAKLLNRGKELVIAGTFRYQACDDKVCYLPRTIPLKWTIQITEPDRQRVPEALRREK